MATRIAIMSGQLRQESVRLASVYDYPNSPLPPIYRRNQYLTALLLTTAPISPSSNVTALENHVRIDHGWAFRNDHEIWISIRPEDIDFA